MNGGARRQLPSWMLKSHVVDRASISEVKEEDKENDPKELDTTGCKPQKKVKRNQHDTEAPLLKSKSQLLKKSEARSSKKKSINHEEHQGDDLDESDIEKKDNVKARKRSQDGDKLHLLKKCEARKRQRTSNKLREDQGNDLCESDTEKQVDVAVRKRYQDNAIPKRKKHKAKELLEDLHNGTVECISNDDELTTEDLISIAQEYVDADGEQKLQKSKNMGFESESKPLHTDISKLGSEKDLTVHPEDRISITDKQLSTNSPSTESSVSGGNIFNPSYTDDPARDILHLFLGPLLKASEEMERKTDMTEKIIRDHELSKTSQNDTLAEVAPVTKKKSSLKDKMAMLLD